MERIERAYLFRWQRPACAWFRQALLLFQESRPSAPETPDTASIRVTPVPHRAHPNVSSELQKRIGSLQQFVIRAGIYDPSLLEYMYHVAIAHRLKTVCDYQQRLSAGQCSYRF